jgi:uncharacterized protein YjiS (DUF1127 family)
VSDFHCYVSKEGSDYDKAVRKEYQQQDHWKDVMHDLSKLMDEKIDSIYMLTFNLGFPPNTIANLNDEHKKMFTKSHMLKQNGKTCRELRDLFKSLLSDYGLSNYQSISDLRLGYGMFKSSPKQESQSFRDFDGRIYMRCNFIPSGAKRSLTEMSELEYAETYANLLKEQERRKALKEGE